MRCWNKVSQCLLLQHLFGPAISAWKIHCFSAQWVIDLLYFHLSWPLSAWLPASADHVIGNVQNMTTMTCFWLLQLLTVPLVHRNIGFEMRFHYYERVVAGGCDLDDTYSSCSWWSDVLKNHGCIRKTAMVHSSSCINMCDQPSLLIYMELHYYVVLHFRAPLKSYWSSQGKYIFQPLARTILKIKIRYILQSVRYWLMIEAVEQIAI